MNASIDQWHSRTSGSGKTRIAVRLLLHERARLEAQGCFAAFLAPTAALCMQVREAQARGETDIFYEMT